MNIRILFLFVTVTCSVAGVFGQKQAAAQPPTAQTLKELETLATRIYDAGINGDRATLAKLIHDDFLEVDAVGELHDKAWNLANPMGTNETIIHRIEQAQVKQHGSVAVLFYIWVVNYSTKGEDRAVKDSIYRLRVTDTFSKQADGWKLISSHRSRLPKTD